MQLTCSLTPLEYDIVSLGFLQEIPQLQTCSGSVTLTVVYTSVYHHAWNNVCGDVFTGGTGDCHANLLKLNLQPAEPRESAWNTRRQAKALTSRTCSDHTVLVRMTLCQSLAHIKWQ